MTPPRARVAAVVVSWRSRAWLEGCLRSLGAQTRALDELIVVDNDSRDGTLEWLAEAHPGVRVLALGANTGFAHAANRGIEATDAELVALVNPDVRLAPDWVARLAGRLEASDSSDAAAVAGKMVDLDDPRVVYDAGDVLRRDGACVQRGRRHRDDGSFDAPGEVFGACAGAAIYRRAAVRAVGGLSERYWMYLEDVDLALALGSAGWRCLYEPAVARHAGEGSSPAAGAHHRWVARNTVLLVATWFPVRWLGPVAYRQLALLVLAARERRLAAHLAGLAAGLRALPGALRDRRRRSAPAVAIERLVPAQPIRGPRAAGHPDAIAASWYGVDPAPHAAQSRR